MCAVPAKLDPVLLREPRIAQQNSNNAAAAAAQQKSGAKGSKRNRILPTVKIN